MGGYPHVDVPPCGYAGATAWGYADMYVCGHGGVSTWGRVAVRSCGTSLVMLGGIVRWWEVIQAHLVQ